MKTICLLWLICAGIIPASAAPTPGHRLVWQDDFAGSTLDTARWQYRTDTRFWSTQLPANVSVSNGLLHLHLKKENLGTIQYTAGGVISRELFRYGYYEARMKVPPGSGWHTSFWMMKYNRPATDTVAIELDVIENDSVDPLEYGVNVHRHLPAPHITFGNKFITTPSLNADFHIFGCEFTPATIRYYFDGNLVQTVDATLLPHDDMNIWLTSVAAPLGGTTFVDDSQLPATAQFDYVRYYEPFPLPTATITQPASHAVTLADETQTLSLSAVTSTSNPAPTVAWSKVQGPGEVLFSDPDSLSTRATFSQTGTYLIQFAATNEGGTTVDQVRVGVAAPTILSLYQGQDEYQHTATIIRADQTSWNAGARDQLLVGRSSGAFRSVLSFPLASLSAAAEITGASLEFRTSATGVGTLGNIELRCLLQEPVEGSGIADGSNPNIGSGTGTTWLTHSGGSTPGDLWNTPGGDFEGSLLSSREGFDATVPGHVFSFPESPAFTAAVQNAHSSGQPLLLILKASNETSGIAFARIGSDDHADPSLRPRLHVSFDGNRLPEIQTANLSPLAGTSLPLSAVTIGGNDIFWEMISGPQSVTLLEPTAPQPVVSFAAPGTYQFRLHASNAYGTSSRIQQVTVQPNPAIFAQWQQITWPGLNNPAVTAPDEDPDHDGLSNLLEWALHLDPVSPDRVTQQLNPATGTLEYTYNRRLTAPGEASYQIEWSDTLPGTWTSTGITEHEPTPLTPTSESVRFTLPESPTGKRFVRIKVTAP
jgi:beta-glucanase (GH16 family)